MPELNRTPKLFEWYFNEAVCSSPTEKTWLTFDDGPDKEWTKKFSELLAGKNIKGLFFIVGDRVNDFGLIKSLIEDGHDIGWHGQYHTSFVRMNREELLHQFDSKFKIEDKLGYTFKYFRFPYGYFLPYMFKVVKGYEMTAMFWSYMIHDYKDRDKELIYKKLKKVKQKDIVLLHDRSNNTKNTFLGLEKYLNESNLDFRTLKKM